MNRRQLLLASAAASAAFTLTGLAAPALAEEPKPAPRGPFDAGALSDFGADGVIDKFAKSHRALIIRKDSRLIAPSAVCTHKSCTLKPKDGDLACPCHGSRYSLAGAVTKGPSRRALPRYAISLDAQNHVIVDTSKTYEEKNWTDPAAFINLEA